MNDFLNDVAIRCFREQADRDYIIARLSYRREFYCQYHWNGLQAIEKYIKAILLFNRIPSIGMSHSLSKGLELLQKVSFVSFQDRTKQIIQYFDAFGCNRYLTYSYAEMDYYLGHFDFAIWDIRKYCRPLDIKYSRKPLEKIQQQLVAIANSSMLDVKSVYIEGGLLENILQNKHHPARKDLTWQNPCFFLKNRKTVKQKEVLAMVNSPLTLHPEYLDELMQYIQISKFDEKNFRQESERRNQPKRK